jgi:hypothetical protein
VAFTLASLKAAVQARGYGTDTTTVQTTLAQAAVRRATAARRWSFRNTTLATAVALGADEPTVQPTMAHVESVAIVLDGDRVPLPYIAPEGLREADESETGTPECWTWDGAEVKLWPAADTAYDLHIYGVATVTVPDDDADVIAWPDDYMDVLVELIVADLAARQRDWSARGDAIAQYDRRLADMTGEYAIRQRGTSDQVASWTGWENIDPMPRYRGVSS